MKSKLFYSPIINLTAVVVELAAGGFTTATDFLKEGLSPARIELYVQSAEDSFINKIFLKNPATKVGRELAYHFYYEKKPEHESVPNFPLYNFNRDLMKKRKINL